MKLVGKVPVEPLSEERLTNIERKLVIATSEMPGRSMRAGRRGVGFAFAALAVAGAAVLGWKLRGAPEVAVVADTPIAVDTTSERSTLDIGDAQIASDPATKYVVTRPAGGVLVAMAHGKVELAVEKRGTRAPLVVRAGDTDVEVVGTKFSVAWDGKGPVEVRVIEGKVKVTRQNATVFVAGGEQWSSSDSKVVALAAVQTPEIDVAIGVPPTVPAESVKKPAGATQGSGGGSGGGSGAAKKPLTKTEELRRAVKNAPLEPALEVPAGDDAVAYYQRLIKEHADTDAESKAFYSLALLQFNANNEALALRTLDLYFKRFDNTKHDGSATYTGALWLRLRILCLRSFEGECRRAAHIFNNNLASSVTSPKAGIATEITLLP